MYRSLFIILLTLLSYSSSQAQNTRLHISGFVTDVVTGEPLPFATIFSNNAAAYADESGYYRFSYSPGNAADSLRIKFVGYHEGVFAPTAITGSTLDINLVRKAVLPTINVRAPEIQAPGGSIIAADLVQLKRQPLLGGEEDYLKALTLLPGITTGVEGTSNLQLRGGSPDQTQLIVDGNPLYYANHIGGFLSALPPYMIKKITVYKGGVPAQFGGRLSGVLDVLLHAGDRQQRTGEASIGTATLRAGLRQPIGKRGSLQASGRLAYPSLLIDAVRSGDFEAGVKGDKTNFRIYDFVGKYARPVKQKGYFSVTAFGSGDNGLLQEALGSEVVLDRFNWRNYFVAARYFRGLGGGWTLSVNPYFSDFTYNYFTVVNEHPVDRPIQQVNRNEQASGVRDLGVSTQVQWQVNNNHQLTVDLFTVRHDFTANAGRTARFEQEIIPVFNTAAIGWERAFALAYEFSIWQKKINGYAALRGSQFVGKAYRTKLLPEPRLRLQYALSNSMKINAGYDVHTQYLHQIKVEGSLLPSDIWVLNNDGAPPARSQQFYLGVSGRTASWEWYLEAYKKRMQHLIRLAFAQTSGFSFTEDWTEAIYNAGEGRAQGLEAYLARTTTRWQASLAYALSTSDRRYLQIDDGKWFPFTYDRRHVVTTTATFEPNDKWSFSGSLAYQSGHAVTLPTAVGIEFLVFDKFNRGRMPGFFRMDIAISKFWNARRCPSNKKSLRFTVYNLTNRANPHQLLIRPQREEVTDPATGVVSSTTEWRIFQLSLFPIIPSLSYQVSFGGKK